MPHVSGAFQNTEFTLFTIITKEEIMKKSLVVLSVIVINISLFAQADNPFQTGNNPITCLDTRTDSHTEDQSRAPSPPIAEAKVTVSIDGVMSKEYNIESVTWNPTEKAWEVSLPYNINYNNWEFVTNVTPVATVPVTTAVNTMGGKLMVYLWDQNGNKLKLGFHLHIIY